MNSRSTKAPRRQISSLVDLRYRDKPFLSKVVWGISKSNVFNRWFYNSPFRIDLFGNSCGNDEEEGKVIISPAQGLLRIQSIDDERKEGQIWKELRDGRRVSWIVMNRKAKQAANVSSWVPLEVQRHWPSNKDFLLRFGSVLLADDILPCQVVECILLVKLRMNNDTNSGCLNLELTQASMQLEDMECSHVHGRNSLMVLSKELSSRRSRNYSEVLECCNLYSRVRSEIREEKMRNESRIDRICILSGKLQ